MSQVVIASLIQFWAPVYGVPSNVALAVAQHESGLKMNAVGKLGEVGVFQLRPEFHREYTMNQLKDPMINITVGLETLKKSMDTCVHKVNLGYLVCFNYGNKNAKKVHHPELFPYVQAVKRLMVAKR